MKCFSKFSEKLHNFQSTVCKSTTTEHFVLIFICNVLLTTLSDFRTHPHLSLGVPVFWTNHLRALITTLVEQNTQPRALITFPEIQSYRQQALMRVLDNQKCLRHSFLITAKIGIRNQQKMLILTQNLQNQIIRTD